MTERRTPQTAVRQPATSRAAAAPTPLEASPARLRAVEAIVNAADDEVVDRRTGRRSLGVEQKPGEAGGSDRPEPTRFGDWEVGGRCTDF